MADDDGDDSACALGLERGPDFVGCVRRDANGIDDPREQRGGERLRETDGAALEVLFEQWRVDEAGLVAPHE